MPGCIWGLLISSVGGTWSEINYQVRIHKKKKQQHTHTHTSPNLELLQLPLMHFRRSFRCHACGWFWRLQQHGFNQKHLILCGKVTQTTIATTTGSQDSGIWIGADLLKVLFVRKVDFGVSSSTCQIVTPWLWVRSAGNQLFLRKGPFILTLWTHFIVTMQLKTVSNVKQIGHSDEATANNHANLEFFSAEHFSVFQLLLHLISFISTMTVCNVREVGNNNTQFCKGTF